MKSKTLLSTLLLLGALTSCRVMDTPTGYVSIDAMDPDVFHAVSPSGNTLRVRVHENPEEGTLQFWQEAIQRTLTEERGYTVIASVPVSTAAGLGGIETTYAPNAEKPEYLYVIDLFIDDDRVIVVEAGGEFETFSAELDAIRASVRSLR